MSHQATINLIDSVGDDHDGKAVLWCEQLKSVMNISQNVRQ